jgi:prepilin-type N-terminal cleavage/methylation domain-containing protein
MIRQNSNVSSRLAGFTLIELVMVIVIIGILSAVAIIKNPFNSIKLNRSVIKVIADIRYVQKLAISNQTRAGITFNIDGYTVYSTFSPSTPAMSPGDTCSSDASNNFVVDFTEPRCSNYQNIQITILPATNPIAFNSLGTPVNSTTGIGLASQTITVFLSGAGSQTINIEAGTGRVY